jgi:hypothetical protein
MTMCEPLPQNDCEKTELEELILSAVAFLARMCHVPENKLASWTPMVASLEAGCGGKCFASLSICNQDGYWRKMYGTYSALPMFTENQEEHLDEYSATWPKMGMMLHGFVMVLPMLEHRTKGTGYSSWPTPAASEARQGFQDRSHGKKGKQESLSTVVARNWPTPRANDAEKRGNIANDVRNGLPAAVKMWPTPGASLRGDCPSERNRNTPGLISAVKMFATPQARDYRTGQQSRWDDPNRSRNLNDQIGGQLNADWVECLMSFPIGWTDINCDEPQEWPGWPAPLTKNMWRTPDAWMGGRGTNTEVGYKKCVETNENSVKLNDQAKFEKSGQYPYEPPRVITGQKNRAKRLKCVGNAVAPKQIFPVFMAIAAIEKARTC